MNQYLYLHKIKIMKQAVHEIVFSFTQIQVVMVVNCFVY